MNNTKQVLLFGATGNMGGAAARELINRGWRVRAVTRNLAGEKALLLAQLGAEVVQADMEDRASLEKVFDGMRRVFSVQNWTTSGVEGEIRQGKLVADVAKSAGVEHLVYGSAGNGEPDSGVPHFQAKVEVESYMRKLGLPFSVVRPGPFMELLSEKEFFPAMGTWGVEPKIVGWQLPLPWVAVHDLGVAIAEIFQHKNKWLGQDVTMFGDVKNLRECRTIFKKVDGKNPFRVPLPLWIFRKMAGEEFIIMWEWMVEFINGIGPRDLWKIVDKARELNPSLLDLESWLTMKRKHAMAMPVVSHSVS